MQKFVAEESFWELFPQASIGVVVARGMKGKDEVPASDAAEIARLLSDANERAKAYLTSETISENAPVKVWREAYRLFKTKKGARCSLENLLKRVLKDNPVGSITPAVDVYNAISLKHALPVGGEDLDAVARRPAPGDHRRRGRVRAARRGRGRPHPAGRALLPGRRGCRLPMLQLARRAAHGAHGQLEERGPRRGMSRTRTRGRPQRCARRVRRPHGKVPGSHHRRTRRCRPGASGARRRRVSARRSGTRSLDFGFRVRDSRPGNCGRRGLGGRGLSPRPDRRRECPRRRRVRSGSLRAPCPRA